MLLQGFSGCFDDVFLSNVALPIARGTGSPGAVGGLGKPDLQALVIIATSGYDADMYPGRSRRAGFDHHLVKPVSIDALLPLLGKKLTDRVV